MVHLPGCSRLALPAYACAAVAVVVGAARAPSTDRPPLPERQRPLSFTKDVAPLVFRHCTPCHRPGGSAPFSLLNYRDAKDRAPLIAAAVEERRMPPWLPEPGYGTFADERRLSDDEIDLIRRWVDEGAIEGDPGDLPPTPEWRDEWELGIPDLIVSLPRYELPAGGSDVYRNLVASIDALRPRG
jgi:mono/diheme cytochrome c family protein